MSSTYGKNIFPGMTGDYLQDQKEMVEASMCEVVNEMSVRERCESSLHRPTQRELEVFIVADVNPEVVNALRGHANVGTTGHIDHGKSTLTGALMQMDELMKLHDKRGEQFEFMIRNCAAAEPVEPIKLLNHPPNPWAKRKKGGFRKYT